MHGVRNALRSEMAVVDLKLTDDEPIYKPRLKVTVTPPAFNFKPKNGDVFVWEGKKEEPKKPAPAPEKPAEKPIKAEVDPFIPEEKPSPKKAMSFYDVVRQGAGKPAAGKAAEPETEYRDKAPVKQEEKTPEPQEQMTLIREEIPADKPKTPALQLSVMGILDDVYIVSTDGRDLYIVDQHAAHERILYNKWKQEAEKKMVVLQALLEPIRMELSPLEAAFIRENAGTFERVGFLPEFMGGNTVILREVPLLFGKNRGDSAFKTLLSGLMDRSKMTSVSAVSEDVIMRLACRVAVKAGDRMDTPTAERLIKDLLLTEDYLTCPHGRPTMLKMSRQELTKYFKRI